MSAGDPPTIANRHTDRRGSMTTQRRRLHRASPRAAVPDPVVPRVAVLVDAPSPAMAHDAENAAVRRELASLRAENAAIRREFTSLRAEFDAFHAMMAAAAPTPAPGIAGTAE